MNKDMDKEQFLKELNKEGLLIYGTTWLENFKRLQELKRYKEMWEALYINSEWLTTKAEMENMKQKYFSGPIRKTITIEIEGDKEDMSKFVSRLTRTIGQINFGVRTEVREGR